MSLKHQMRIHELPFRQIKGGTKNIEVRLFDEKRQKIKVGDIIEFVKRPDFSEKAEVEVVELLRYPTFSKLFDNFPAEVFGGKDKEDLMTIYKYYSKEDEEKHGVLGIKIKLVE